MSCSKGCRCSSDMALLWLWCRLAVMALIQPLAWEFPYAVCAALKRQQTNKQKPTPRYIYPKEMKTGDQKKTCI